MKTRILNASNGGKAMILAIIILFICSAEKGINQKINFSGTWLINLQKSEFGEAPRFTANRQLIIKQQSNNINLERFYFKADGLDSTTVDKDILLFNGATYHTKTVDKRQKTASLSWSKDGQQLIIQSRFSAVIDTTQEEYNNQEIWSLSTDKRTLIIDKSVHDADGSGYSIKAVYDKK